MDHLFRTIQIADHINKTNIEDLFTQYYNELIKLTRRSFDFFETFLSYSTAINQKDAFIDLFGQAKELYTQKEKEANSYVPYIIGHKIKILLYNKKIQMRQQHKPKLHLKRLKRMNLYFKRPKIAQVNVRQLLLSTFGTHVLKKVLLMRYSAMPSG